MEEAASQVVPMSPSEAAVTFIFGVLLPSVDVWSDMWFALRLLFGDWTSCDPVEKNRYLFATMSLIFPLVSFLFICYHWWLLEDAKRVGGSGRWKTLPLLLLQVWPQYRMLRLIYLGFWTQDPRWKQVTIRFQVSC